MLRLLVLLLVLAPCIAVAQTPPRPTYGVAALERDVTTRLPAFEACARDQRRLGEPVDGRLRLSVMVNPEATLSPLMILENTTTNLALAECVGWATREAHVELAPTAAQTMTFELTFDERGVTFGAFTNGPDAVSTAANMDPALERAEGLTRPRRGSGEFSSEIVGAAMRRTDVALTTCYEALLRERRDLAGRIVVEFSIRMSGAVHEIVISANTTGSLRLATCICDTTARLHFDPGPVGGEVRYRYPYVFTPVD